MFDLFPKLLSSIASILFPIFASYKALKTSDPAQLTPWLMYWVVLSMALLVESWLDWILFWVPFYGYFRLLFLLYLVLPQTQGARVLYQEHVHPWMAENEAAIDDFIASAHDRLKAAGISYLKRAIEMLRTNVLGMQPSEEPAAAASEAQQTPQGYTASLLARFSLPAARWTAATAGAAGADFYNLLAGAVAAATSSAAGTSTSGGASGTAATSADAAKDLSASGTLIPPSIRGTAERASFVAAQRERLAILLSALDREARQLDASRQQEAQESKQRQASAGEGRPRKGSVALDGATDAASSETSSLPRTRGSEVDFEKIDAESGAEEETGDGVRRRVPVSRSVSNAGDKAGGGGGASWLPWGWRSGGGGGGPEPSGTSSAIERDK